MLKTSKRDNGFTLLEIMISLSILAICIIALVRLYTTAMNASAFGRRATEAIALGEDKMEELRTMDITALVAGTWQEERVAPDGTVTAVDPDVVPFNGANGFFARRWLRQDDLLQGAITLTVSVSWLEQGQDARTFTMQAQRSL